MRFVHDNLYPLFTALVAIALVIVWFGVPEPSQAPAVTPIEDQWEFPTAIEHNSKQSIDLINARNIWGIVAVVVVEKVPEWHVLGIATNGTERFVLLSVEGKPAETLVVGDLLPDGLKIAAIEKDRFFVMTPNKKKIAFGIYKNDQAK